MPAEALGLVKTMGLAHRCARDSTLDSIQLARMAGLDHRCAAGLARMAGLRPMKGRGI